MLVRSVQPLASLLHPLGQRPSAPGMPDVKSFLCVALAHHYHS